MNPDKVKRDQVYRLTDLPNIGPAMAKDLELIGINRPEQLASQDPLLLYERLCLACGARQDPCVLDTFASQKIRNSLGISSAWMGESKGEIEGLYVTGAARKPTQ